jgi:hypothetical protein
MKIVYEINDVIQVRANTLCPGDFNLAKIKNIIRYRCGDECPPEYDVQYADGSTTRIKEEDIIIPNPMEVNYE